MTGLSLVTRGLSAAVGATIVTRGLTAKGLNRFVAALSGSSGASAMGGRSVRHTNASGHSTSTTLTGSSDATP